MSNTHVIDQRPTGASIGRGAGIEAPTRTISDLVDDYGFFRNVTRNLADDTRRLHRRAVERHGDTLDAELRTMAGKHAKRPMQTLLAELSDLGFSWRDIARVAGISVPALRKWRQGGKATGVNRLRVACVVSVCEIARSRYLIPDAAGWLETPLHPEAPITGLDILSGGRPDLMLRLACDPESDPRAVLDEFEPDWQIRYRSDVEVFTAPDGIPGLRLADRPA